MKIVGHKLAMESLATSPSLSPLEGSEEGGTKDGTLQLGAPAKLEMEETR